MDLTDSCAAHQALSANFGTRCCALPHAHVSYDAEYYPALRRSCGGNGAFPRHGAPGDLGQASALRADPRHRTCTRSMNPYILLLAGTGALILLVAWLPMALKEMPLSLPMFCVAFGFAAFSLSAGDRPHPLVYPELTERMSELVVIVALTSAGLKLDRPFSWRSWSLTWRLLGIAMPLSIL